MKNLDLENIERKTPYTLPENFFSEMQQQVLSKTTQNLNNLNLNEGSKKTNIIRPKYYWTYAVAASLIMVFGLIFYFKNTDDTKNQYAKFRENLVSEQQLAINNIANNSSQDSNVVNLVSNYKNQDLKNQVLTSTSNHMEVKNTSEIERLDPPVYKTIVTKTVSISNPIPVSKASNLKKDKEAKVEQALNNITDADISSIANNAENDVYLDLYN